MGWTMGLQVQAVHWREMPREGGTRMQLASTVQPRTPLLPSLSLSPAEALGAIGTSECVDFLKAYEEDPVVMLKESCQVALDCVDYWNAFKKDEGGEGEAADAAAAAPAGEVSA